MPSLYREISLAGQTAYAELVEQARAASLHPLAGLTGSFQRRSIKGHEYVYFGYRDSLDGAQRRAYVGPATERVMALVSRFEEERAPKRLAPNAQAALAYGCADMLPKHYRIVRQLAAYGFFRAGGVLIGTHAFVAMANMLGVRWTNGDKTLDLDFAHAARHLALALPADLRLSVHDALTSLELGLLPIQELSGKTGGHYRNPEDAELRIDFVTPMSRGGHPVSVPDLGLVLEPLKFLEFLLEGTTQAAVLSRDGACLVNLPGPERFAIHKLIIAGERRAAERVKSVKDLHQVAALAQWHQLNGQAAAFNRAFRDAIGRGQGWLARANRGRRALLARHPELDDKALWRSG